MAPLGRLTDLLRARNRVPPAELRAYSDLLNPAVRQLAGLFARWRLQLEVDSPEEDLANAASIQRWEAAGLADRLRSTRAPSALARQHAELESLATDTARAAQLLSNGYRFHSSRARCDGQALMLASEERFGALRAALDRQGVSVQLDADDVGRSR